MANFRSAKDLKEDILFRASEPRSGTSQWDEAGNQRAMSYLNRVYRSLATGASEFLPEYIEDWWWMRQRGVLYLLPVIKGTTAVVKGSNIVTLTDDPNNILGTMVLDIAILGPTGSALDVRGWRFWIEGHPDVFVVQDLNVAALTISLDMPYTGPSQTVASYSLAQDTYKLADNVASLLSPMSAFRERRTISGMAADRMDELYPISNLQSGVPDAFCLENDTTVRFNRAGRDDGVAMRVEYRYKPNVEDLVDNDNSMPLVPLQYRHLLADMALVYLMIDKNDDRATAANASARSGLAAMVKENKRRVVQMDREAGRIYARPIGRYPLMTQSGLYVRP